MITRTPAQLANALTVDVEDYFHVEAFATQVHRDTWESLPSRVEANVERSLELLERHRVQATFFILGWVARRFPLLVRTIAEAGHEIGCHGFAHQHLRKLTPQEFRADLRLAREWLTHEAQRSLTCYRAPTFSIVRDTAWALDVLCEEGFEKDSSIFPIRHDFCGIPDAKRFPHWYRTARGNMIFEFPPSTIRVVRNNLAVAGGGYLRLFPYTLTRWALKKINGDEGQPGMVYFHPWELDSDQPRIGARWRSRFRHYTNLATTETKLEKLLQEFKFTTFSGACEQLETYRERAAVPWIA